MQPHVQSRHGDETRKKQLFDTSLVEQVVRPDVQDTVLPDSAALASPSASPLDVGPLSPSASLLLFLGLWSKLASLPQLPIRGLLTLIFNNTACWASLSDAHSQTYTGAHAGTHTQIRSPIIPLWTKKKKVQGERRSRCSCKLKIRHKWEPVKTHEEGRECVSGLASQIHTDLCVLFSEGDGDAVQNTDGALNEQTH